MQTRSELYQHFTLWLSQPSVAYERMFRALAFIGSVVAVGWLIYGWYIDGSLATFIMRRDDASSVFIVQMLIAFGLVLVAVTGYRTWLSFLPTFYTKETQTHRDGLKVCAGFVVISLVVLIYVLQKLK